MIILDPGHGLYRSRGSWVPQRNPFVHGRDSRMEQVQWDGTPHSSYVIEDFITPYIAKYCAQRLDYYSLPWGSTRPFPGTDVGDSIGESGHPRWMEGALYFLGECAEGNPRGGDRVRDLVRRPLWASSRRPMIAISIHCDAADNPEASGTSVFYKSGSDKALANQIYGNISEVREYIGNRANPVRTPLSNWAWVLHMDPGIRCLLIECLFFTNYRDAKLLLDERSLEDIGKRIADGMYQSLVGGM